MLGIGFSYYQKPRGDELEMLIEYLSESFFEVSTRLLYKNTCTKETKKKPGREKKNGKVYDSNIKL